MDATSPPAVSAAAVTLVPIFLADMHVCVSLVGVFLLATLLAVFSVKPRHASYVGSSKWLADAF